MSAGQGGIVDARLAVNNPVVKKMTVAIRDRGDKREMPQSMCPEVQPLPLYLIVSCCVSNGHGSVTFVPHPSKNPVPSVDSMEDVGAAGYVGNSDGMSK